MAVTLQEGGKHKPPSTLDLLCLLLSICLQPPRVWTEMSRVQITLSIFQMFLPTTEESFKFNLPRGEQGVLPMPPCPELDVFPSSKCSGGHFPVREGPSAFPRTLFFSLPPV
jgi:hypothetical protein